MPFFVHTYLDFPNAWATIQERWRERSNWNRGRVSCELREELLSWIHLPMSWLIHNPFLPFHVYHTSVHSCVIFYQWVQWWICSWTEVPGRQVLHSQTPVHCGHNPWQREGNMVKHTRSPSSDTAQGKLTLAIDIYFGGKCLEKDTIQYTVNAHLSLWCPCKSKNGNKPLQLTVHQQQTEYNNSYLKGPC